MMTVWKYDIPAAGAVFEVEMPEGAKVRTMGVQPSCPVMWAYVDTEAPKVTRKFLCLATGQPAPDGVNGSSELVSTIQVMGPHGEPIVWHLVEVDPPVGKVLKLAPTPADPNVN